MKEFLSNLKEGTPLWLHLTMLASIVLVFISFFLPPKGVIHPSTLKAVGELGLMASVFTFLSNLSEYINAGHQVRLSKGDLTIQVQKKDEDDKEGEDGFAEENNEETNNEE